MRQGKEFVDAGRGTEDGFGMSALLASLGRAPDVIAKIMLLDDLEHFARLCLFNKGLLSQHGWLVCFC